MIVETSLATLSEVLTLSTILSLYERNPDQSLVQLATSRSTRPYTDTVRATCYILHETINLRQQWIVI